MKAARCAPTLCGGKPTDLAADTASHQLNFLAARLNGTESPPKQPAIRRMSGEMGFTPFDPRNVEPLPGWKFCSHLILLDMDALLRTPPEGKWVQAMVLAVSSAEIPLGTSTN